MFFLFVLMVFVSFAVISCTEVDAAMVQQIRMENEAKYTSESAVARSKLEVEEQNFKVFRRVVFYNVVTYFSEAIQPQAITTDKYKVTFKPSMILPSVEIR